MLSGVHSQHLKHTIWLWGGVTLKNRIWKGGGRESAIPRGCHLKYIAHVSDKGDCHRRPKHRLLSTQKAIYMPWDQKAADSGGAWWRLVARMVAFTSPKYAGYPNVAPKHGCTFTRETRQHTHTHTPSVSSEVTGASPPGCRCSRCFYSLRATRLLVLHLKKSGGCI